MAKESVAGRFTLVEELGRGGMGVVWRATDTLLGREVAVKRIVAPPGLPGEARARGRARMVLEGRAAARLDHPNAVAVHDVLDEEDGIYIVMEFVRALSLRELVRREGPLPVGRAATLGLQLLDALTAAHAAGIVHRDVKPANVLVQPEDRVKLADFGLTGLTGEARLTGRGAHLGSPAYLAPEQARGDICTPASDLWSLGATLYYALEGRDAFEAPVFSAVIAKILDGVPALPRNAGPLEPLLAGLLAKDPMARPQAPVVRKTLAGSVDAHHLPLPVETPPEDCVPRQFEAKVRARGFVAEAVSGVVLTALVCLGLVTVLSQVVAAETWVLAVPVGLAGLLWAGRLVSGCANGILGHNAFEVGPRGISFARGGYSAGYGWDQVLEVGLVRRGLRRRRTLMVRPVDGQGTSRLTGTPGRSPWLDRKTGRVGLCRLDELKADPETVERQVRTFAGSRWRS